MLYTHSLTGLPTDTSRSQTYSFENTFLLLVLDKKEEGSLVAIGKQLLIQFEERFTTHHPRSLQEAKNLVTEFISAATDVTISSFALGIVVESVLYLVVKNSSVFIIRRGKLQEILTSSDESIISASGKVQPADIIVLTSQQLTSCLTDAVKTEISSLSANEINDVFSSLLLQMSDSSKIAACITSIGGEVLLQNRPTDPSPVSPPTQSPTLASEHPQPIQEEPEVQPLVATVSSITPHHPSHHPQPPVYRKFRKPLFLKKYLPRFSFNLRLSKSQLYISSVGLVGILLLAGFFFFKLSHRFDDQTEQQFLSLYTQAQQKYDEGKALASLNTARSYESLKAAQTLITQAKATTSNHRDREDKLNKLEEQVVATTQVTLKIHTVQNPPLFFDLALVKDKAVGSSFALANDQFLLLDKQNKLVYSLTTSKKSSIVSGNFNNPQFVTIGNDFGFVIDTDVEKVSLDKKSHAHFADIDSSCGESGGVTTFDGNIYLLCKAGKIIKYTSDGNAHDYLNTDVAPDFSSASSITIDGDVWVLFKSGEVIKYVRGVPDVFTLQGLDKPLANATGITTNEDGKYLYILDTNNKRIVLFDKEGNYFSQYAWSGIDESTSIAVSEQDKKLYILKQHSLYQISLEL